jgi:hypothetical protein
MNDSKVRQDVDHVATRRLEAELAQALQELTEARDHVEVLEMTKVQFIAWCVKDRNSLAERAEKAEALLCSVRERVAAGRKAARYQSPAARGATNAIVLDLEAFLTEPCTHAEDAATLMKVRDCVVAERPLGSPDRKPGQVVAEVAALLLAQELAILGEE